MKTQLYRCQKASYLIFEDIFNEQELQFIWQEASFLCDKDKFFSPSTLESGSARDSDGNLLKNNKCIWFEHIYQKNYFSNYLRLYKKPFANLNKEELIKKDLDFKVFFNTNWDSTLVSYYENEDYYDSHVDIACYTYVFWLFKEPKQFYGGDLTFPELEKTINVKSNMGVLFPSWLDHQVSKISMPDHIQEYKGNGRFAYTTFFHI